MYLEIKARLRDALAKLIRAKYHMELPIVLERPPKIDMGEAASPVCFELAKRLKKAPRQIAQEIQNALPPIPGIAKVDVAGAGYLNAYFDRGAFWEAAQNEAKQSTAPQAVDRRGEKIIVEHTSINPNKAAHIGHVRNAVLGDTMARTLRYAGHNVQVQNYIDNTGVQVADVVIGLLHMERRTPVSVKMLAMDPRFDYYCWDVYAKATQFFAEDKERAAKLRGETLKAIEAGQGEEAEVGQVVADAIVTCHLRTMARLGISYELLARESEILHLHFWDLAFAKLKEAGAIQFVQHGKMAGCWVMPWREEGKDKNSGTNTEDTESQSTENAEGPEEEENTQDKIIVRSNGTVTYVGKDIAYQLWKFGLLGKDFHYAKWPNAPEGEEVWATTSGENDPKAPPFGAPAKKVYNVIDTRQAYLQDVVALGLRGLGHADAADNSIHLSYEIVALTPRCAAELSAPITGNERLSPAPEDSASTTPSTLAPPTNLTARAVEVSGRKGIGVKADDLIDRLELAAETNVLLRHPDISQAERKHIGHQIAVGALRFFLLKFTRSAIIVFDFQDALNFEGETGPYCQYAVVRIRGIRRKAAEEGVARVAVTPETAQKLLAGAEGNGLWEVLLAVGSLDYSVDAAIVAQEPAFAAKYAFQLAQAFNNFYHKHHILSEADHQKRAFLLGLTELVETQLVRALHLMGIEAPEKM